MIIATDSVSTGCTNLDGLNRRVFHAYKVACKARKRQLAEAIALASNKTDRKRLADEVNAVTALERALWGMVAGSGRRRRK